MELDWSETCKAVKHAADLQQMIPISSNSLVMYGSNGL